MFYKSDSKIWLKPKTIFHKNLPILSKKNGVLLYMLDVENHDSYENLLISRKQKFLLLRRIAEISSLVNIMWNK